MIIINVCDLSHLITVCIIIHDITVCIIIHDIKASELCTNLLVAFPNLHFDEDFLQVPKHTCLHPPTGIFRVILSVILK